MKKKKSQRKFTPVFFIFAILGWGGYWFSPYLLDSIPPILKVGKLIDQEIYSGKIDVEIMSTDPTHRSTGLKSVTAQIDQDIPIKLEKRKRFSRFYTNRPPAPFVIDTTNLDEGFHSITVVATDKSRNRNHSQVQYTFFVDNQQTRIETLPDLISAKQGQTSAIFIKTSEPATKVKARIFDKDYSCYPIKVDSSQGYFYRLLIGVGVQESVGIHPMMVSMTDQVERVIEKTFFARVGRIEFAHGGYVKLSPEKKKVMMDKSKSHEDNAKRWEAYNQANKTAGQLWRGHFIRPALGGVTSPFGKYREYNTGVKRHHLGIDIANQVGTAIYVGNSGIVTLVDNLHIYGKTVVINHGQGVSTSYNHLSEVKVEIGRQVEKGQEIGLMGATGQVTGSHLHWGMVVNGTAINAEQWIDQDFSYDEEILGQ
ncbi:TPA: M23 family metallopeptidase [Candidatus Poribacteria bacterium]|nr:M23 family metallopeptidase [Candidatus Poribacteria bacterium]